ncbi:MAG: hypothetical protein AB7I45_01375 [Planctomycetota bacterium]
MATDLALARGLLVPDLRTIAAVQFCLPCEDAPPEALGNSLMRMGFDEVILLVGANGDAHPCGGATIVRAKVEAQVDGLVLRVEDGHGGTKGRGAAPASGRLRAGLQRLMGTVELPRRLPCVVDLADC